MLLFYTFHLLHCVNSSRWGAGTYVDFWIKEVAGYIQNLYNSLSGYFARIRAFILTTFSRCLSKRGSQPPVSPSSWLRPMITYNFPQEGVWLWSRLITRQRDRGWKWPKIDSVICERPQTNVNCPIGCQREIQETVHEKYDKILVWYSEASLRETKKARTIFWQTP